MTADAEREAFRQQLVEVFGVADADQVPLRDGPADVAVPGFVTLEAEVGGYPVRGWARADGTVVMHRRQNFGPIADAVGFADEPPGMDADTLARILMWCHPADFELIDYVPSGTLGLDDDIEAPPRRRKVRPGVVEMRFMVQHREDGTIDAILLYVLRSEDGAPFKHQLIAVAPKLDHDE